MKKLISVLLAVLMLVSLFAGCGSKAEEAAPAAEAAPAQEAAPPGRLLPPEMVL